MARVYATADDYATFTGAAAPADIGQLLAQASRFLDSNLFRLCRYEADQDTGMPTDPVVLGAFSDAACAQAQWWNEIGDTLGTVGVGWSTVSVGSVSLSRGTKVGAASAEDQAARQIAPQVYDALTAPELTAWRFRMGEIRSSVPLGCW